MTKDTSGAIAPKHYLWFALATIALIGVIVLFALDKGTAAESILLFLGGLIVPGSPLGGVVRRPPSPPSSGSHRDDSGADDDEPEDTRRIGPRRVSLVGKPVRASAFLACFVMLLAGCTVDAARATARTIVDTSTLAIRDIDLAAAERYREAAHAAYDASDSWAEYDAAMQVHFALRRAVSETRSAIQLADVTLRAWDEGGKEQWLGMLACIVAGFTDAVPIVERAGVEVPPEIGSVLALASGFAHGVCPDFRGAR